MSCYLQVPANHLPIDPNFHKTKGIAQDHKRKLIFLFSLFLPLFLFLNLKRFELSTTILFPVPLQFLHCIHLPWQDRHFLNPKQYGHGFLPTPLQGVHLISLFFVIELYMYPIHKKGNLYVYVHYNVYNTLWNHRKNMEQESYRIHDKRDMR